MLLRPKIVSFGQTTEENLNNRQEANQDPHNELVSWAAVA